MSELTTTAEPTEQAAGRTDRSWLHQRGFTLRDVFVLIGVGVLPLAAANSLFLVDYAPRVGVRIMIGLLGLVLVARAAIVRRDTASRMLMLVLASFALSGLLSPHVLESLRGSYESHLTFVAFATSMGWWGAGRSLGAAARRAVPYVLAPGVALNGLVAVLEIPAGSSGFAGRADGLFGNPVLFGSFMAMIAGWTLAAAIRPMPRWWPAVIFAVSFAAGLSGGRVVLGAVLVVGLVALAMSRSAATAVAFVAATAGLFAASAYVSTAASNGSGAVDRLGRSGSGFGDRIPVWSYGVEGFLDRPLFGWGLNHFGAGTQRYFTAEFVAAISWDDAAQTFRDPHNLPIYLLTTTGLVGVLLVGAFVAAAMRGDRDVPMLLAVGAVALTWMLQPSNEASLPIALLLLGAAVRPAAARPVVVPESAGGRWRTAQVVAALLGVVLAAYVVVGDALLLRTARQDGDAIERIAAWMPRDPYVDVIVASHYERQFPFGEGDVDGDIVRWRERLAEHAPLRPGSWNSLAVAYLYANDLDAMRSSVDRALDLQFYNPTARRLFVLHARLTEDAEAEREGLAIACELELDICEDDEDSGRGDAP